MTNSTWEMWSDVHDKPDQKKRIESASKSACTPVDIDKENCTGNFKGSSGNHSTALSNCSCIDFNRRRLPCKHMYRLAMELGLLDVSFSSNVSDIVEPQSSSRMLLADSVRIVEQFTVEQQKLLASILGAVSSKKPTYCVSYSADLQVLIDSTIILNAPDIKVSLGKYKKAELSELADSLELTIPKNISKKDDIINYILENSSNQLSSVPLLYSVVQYNPEVKYHKLYMYLHRKFDYSSMYYEINGEFRELTLLETALPDDDVTNLLIQYGYYKREFFWQQCT